MQYQITLTVGHNVKGVPTLTTREVVNCVTTYLGAKGATVLGCDGMWEGVPETSTRIEVVRDNLTRDMIYKRVRKMSRCLRQEAIMCEVKEVTIEFLG